MARAQRLPEIGRGQCGRAPIRLTHAGIMDMQQQSAQQGRDGLLRHGQVQIHVQPVPVPGRRDEHEARAAFRSHGLHPVE